MKNRITTVGSGVKVLHFRGKVLVTNKVLERYPDFAVPIGVRVRSGFIPLIRMNINEWFNKYF